MPKFNICIQRWGRFHESIEKVVEAETEQDAADAVFDLPGDEWHRHDDCDDVEKQTSPAPDYVVADLVAQ